MAHLNQCCYIGLHHPWNWPPVPWSFIAISLFYGDPHIHIIQTDPNHSSLVLLYGKDYRARMLFFQSCYQAELNVRSENTANSAGMSMRLEGMSTGFLQTFMDMPCSIGQFGKLYGFCAVDLLSVKWG